MTLRFGTDGVRGDADSLLTSESVVALGRATARVLGTQSTFLIGTDTRRSGPRIATDFAAGIASVGGACEFLGVLPTPGIAFASERGSQPAVVISASHNVWSDNGIKLFAAGGVKLSDELQAAVEFELGRSDLATFGTTGSVARALGDASSSPRFEPEYEAHLLATIAGRHLDGLRIVLDVAHGAAFRVAPSAFRALGADVSVLHDQPNGENINAGCGSTHPELLQAAVIAQGAAVGFAFDGDADRCLAVDETGAMIDGDELIVALALDLKTRSALANDSVVVTVLSNLGLHHALRDGGISVIETAVGDRSVMEAIEAGGYSLGGEQSGHIIVRDRATTGDGTLVALLFADLMARSGRPASRLKAQMRRLPQLMVNVRVLDQPDLADAEELWAEVELVRLALGSDGRVLVRASGTEPLIRVMVEATTQDIADHHAHRLADCVRRLWA